MMHVQKNIKKKTFKEASTETKKSIRMALKNDLKISKLTRRLLRSHILFSTTKPLNNEQVNNSCYVSIRQQCFYLYRKMNIDFPGNSLFVGRAI
jgi:hypothetical protein